MLACFDHLRRIGGRGVGIGRSKGTQQRDMVTMERRSLNKRVLRFLGECVVGITLTSVDAIPLQALVGKQLADVA